MDRSYKNNLSGKPHSRLLSILPVLTGYNGRFTGDLETIRRNLIHHDKRRIRTVSHLEVYVLALEDRRFFSHRGTHFRSLFREILKSLLRRPHGGASTIDMQFVRTCTNLRERTIRRKIYEIFLSRLLQREADKLTILQSYLEIAYFGSGLKGAAEASELLFSTKPRSLKCGKAADVAALLLRPVPQHRSQSWENHLSTRSAYALYTAPQIIIQLDLDYTKLYGRKAFDADIAAQLYIRGFSVRGNHLIEEHGRKVAFKESPNCGRLERLKYIVLHSTAGAKYSSDVDWMCNEEAKVSAHFVVGRNGELTQLVALNKSAMHAGKSAYGGDTNLNSCSIGIELSNFSHLQKNERGEWKTWFGQTVDDENVRVCKHKHEEFDRGWHRYTNEQIETASALVIALRREFGPLEIAGHEDIATGRKVDPGPAFPMNKFVQVIEYTELANVDTEARHNPAKKNVAPVARAKPAE